MMMMPWMTPARIAFITPYEILNNHQQQLLNMMTNASTLRPSGYQFHIVATFSLVFHRY